MVNYYFAKWLNLMTTFGETGLYRIAKFAQFNPRPPGQNVLYKLLKFHGHIFYQFWDISAENRQTSFWPTLYILEKQNVLV